MRPPNFRPDGPNGPGGRVGPGGFNNFVPVPGFGPPGTGSGAGGPPPRMMGGPPPGPHGPRNDTFGPVGMGLLSGPNGPGEYFVLFFIGLSNSLSLTTIPFIIYFQLGVTFPLG